MQAESSANEIHMMVEEGNMEAHIKGRRLHTKIAVSCAFPFYSGERTVKAQGGKLDLLCGYM